MGTAGEREEVALSTVRLPNDPSIAQLRKQAKELRRAVMAGEPAALAHVAEHFPDRAGSDLPLSAAQTVIARHYGFPSWPRLTGHLTLVDRYSRVADQVEPAARPADQ